VRAHPIRRRVLSIAHSYVVGVNRRLADELARADGWDVTAVTPTRLRGDLSWHTYQPIADERCRVAPVDVHFSRKVHVMLYGRELRSLLQQRWDLVHCWEEPYVAAAAQVVAHAAPRVPLVIATYQNISKRYPPPFNWIERYTLERADGVVVGGRTILDVLTSRGFTGARTRIIPMGVDATRFRPDSDWRREIRASYGWSDDRPVVGFMGRFVPEKGPELLTRVLRGLPAGWRALFVGSGPLEPALRAWAKPYGGDVQFATGVGHDEVPRWLNAMDVLCAPSQTTPRWREQFGRMLIEAFACGVPVIASDSGEIPYVVGDAAIVVGEADEPSWTAALERVLGDAGFRQTLSARGRERAVSTFSWPVVARQHLAFFDQIVDGGLTRYPELS
jgi:glycosyltransferase involved in cell wall biosynthesis